MGPVFVGYFPKLRVAPADAGLEHGIFPTLAAALEGAALFSAGSREPGPYHVAEVLRRDP